MFGTIKSLSSYKVRDEKSKHARKTGPEGLKLGIFIYSDSVFRIIDSKIHMNVPYLMQERLMIRYILRLDLLIRECMCNRIETYQKPISEQIGLQTSVLNFCTYKNYTQEKKREMKYYSLDIQNLILAMHKVMAERASWQLLECFVKENFMSDLEKQKSLFPIFITK